MIDEYPDDVTLSRPLRHDTGTRADPSKDAQAVIDAIEKLTAEVRRLTNVLADHARRNPFS